MITTEYVYGPAIPPLGGLVYPRERTTYVHTNLVGRYLQQLYTQKPKRGDDSNGITC